MSTVKDMSAEYLNEAYELALFLRINNHASLGERIVTAALEVATLSNTTWANYRNEGFYDNLIKTHEVADRLMRLLDIVKYLELPYQDLDKIYEDTTAIYKMSRSSVNTLIKKLNTGRNQQSSTSSSQQSGIDSRPSRQMRNGTLHQEQEEKEIAREGNDTTPETVSELPFEMNGEGRTPEEAGDSAPEEAAEEEATA